MDFGKLNKRIDVYKVELKENEYFEKDNVSNLYKTIWCEIIPKTGSLINGRAGNILSKTTHLIRTRYATAKDIKINDYFIYNEKISDSKVIKHKFDINYILNPYFKNETLEFFVQEVIE